MATMMEDSGLRSRLVIEPKIIGFSGAGHKIEFAVCSNESRRFRKNEMLNVKDLLAFVECKKVGVEQTISGSFKKKFGYTPSIVPYDSPLTVSVSPKWTDRKANFTVKFRGGNNPKLMIHGNTGFGENEIFQDMYDLESGSRFIFGIGVDEIPFFINDNHSLRSIKDDIGACKILEIISITEEGVHSILNDCLPGPQTPEKAKQASFTALDLRKERHGKFDKRIPENDFVSILVITEISHWEEKSRRMIRSCIDHNLVIKDQIIGHAFDVFENNFGSDFLSYIAKGKLKENSDVFDLTRNVIEKFDFKIFSDMDTGENRRIRFENERVKVD